MKTEITLPFPPSVNRYYRSPRSGPLAGRTLISEEARKYRAAVCSLVAESKLGGPMEGLLRVSVEVFVPDRRKRDLDNLGKSLFDSLTHAGVWGDDSQIDDLRIYRARDDKGALIIGGMVKVAVECINDAITKAIG